MSLKEEHKQYTKAQLEFYLNEFAKMLAKKLRGKHFHLEIILVGGASVLLNYNFRQTTEDIDCYDTSNLLLMTDIKNIIADKYSLEEDWINTGFTNTDSFSTKLELYSEFYPKKFGYGVLNIRTVKNEYLIAMKITAGRPYKHDYSDIYGVIVEQQNKGKPITVEAINKALKDLYPDKDYTNTKAYKFAVSIINGTILSSFDDIVKQEKLNKDKLLENREILINKEQRDYLISKLKVL